MPVNLNGNIDMARETITMRRPLRERKTTMLAIAGAIGVVIFAADLLSSLQGALAVLYVIVILLAAQAGGRREAIVAGIFCAALTLLAFAADHLGHPMDAAYVRLGVSLVAITATTVLSIAQQRAEEERQNSEQRYRSIFDSAGFPIWETNWSALRCHLFEAVPEGANFRAWFDDHPEEVQAAFRKAVIVDVNPAAVALFGGTRSELVGRNTIGEFAPGSESVFGNVMVALAEGAVGLERDVQYITLDGRTVDVVLRVKQLDEGEPWSRTLVMALDVTERNEARARFEQAQSELAHAARVSTLGLLAASIAHDVNQPLSAIINYGKSGQRWLARETPDLGETAACLDHIVSNGNRAADVIARIRAHARKDAPKPSMIDLTELVGEAVELVAREARSADISMFVGRDARIKPVIGDRVQVQQVLVNLLINAIQAMRETTGRPRELLIRLEKEEDAVRVDVIDSGTGIAGDPMRVFDPFVTTKSDGMGIGLSICRSIIESQGGHISAANNPDHGATFAFTLPTVEHDTSV